MATLGRRNQLLNSQTDLGCEGHGPQSAGERGLLPEFRTCIAAAHLNTITFCGQPDSSRFPLGCRCGNSASAACWRRVQNPAVLPAPPTTAMSNVSALSARSPSEHVAPEADSLTVDAPSAQPATPDAVTRTTATKPNPHRLNRIPRRLFPEPKVEPTARTRNPTQLRSTPTSPRCAARSSSTHKDADGISVHTFRRRTHYRRDISDRDELHPDVRFGQRPGFGAQDTA